MSTLYDMLKSNKYFDYFSVKQSHDREGLSEEELVRLWNNDNANLKKYKVPYENKYVNIRHMEPAFFSKVKPGDYIVVQEKLDGSNAHIFIDTRGVFTAYSSNLVLNRYTHLQGFYYWCQDNHMKIPKKYWGISIYGEWLVPHHCIYPAECYGQFYIFDVIERGEYWPQSKVRMLAEECGLETVPVLYDWTFSNWSDLLPLVGQTKLGGWLGEGIVIKNQSTLNKEGVSYLKIVDKAFQETNPGRKDMKTLTTDEIAEYEKNRLLIKTVITEARVRKTILKLVDENSLNDPWWRSYDFNSFTIIKRAVLRDCFKEEFELTEQVGKQFPSIAVPILQEIVDSLLQKERVSNGQIES